MKTSLSEKANKSIDQSNDLSPKYTTLSDVMPYRENDVTILLTQLISSVKEMSKTITRVEDDIKDLKKINEEQLNDISSRVTKIEQHIYRKSILRESLNSTPSSLSIPPKSTEINSVPTHEVVTSAEECPGNSSLTTPSRKLPTPRKVNHVITLFTSDHPSTSNSTELDSTLPIEFSHNPTEVYSAVYFQTSADLILEEHPPTATIENTLSSTESTTQPNN